MSPAPVQEGGGSDVELLDPEEAVEGAMVAEDLKFNICTYFCRILLLSFLMMYWL